MIDPTWYETLFAFLGLGVVILIAVSLALGLAKWIGGAGRRLLDSRADADVRILMAEHVHMNRDPLAPDAQYGATNEARQHLRSRGR